MYSYCHWHEMFSGVFHPSTDHYQSWWQMKVTTREASCAAGVVISYYLNKVQYPEEYNEYRWLWKPNDPYNLSTHLCGEKNNAQEAEHYCVECADLTILYYQHGYQKETQPHMQRILSVFPQSNILKVFVYFQVRLQGHSAYLSAADSRRKQSLS